MVFLDHYCSNPDLYECLNHYANAEQGIATHEAIGEAPVTNDLYHPIPSQLDDKIKGCREGSLISRPLDFKSIIDIGVRSFKIARDAPLTRENLDTLCMAIDPINGRNDPTKYIHNLQNRYNQKY